LKELRGIFDGTKLTVKDKCLEGDKLVLEVTSSFVVVGRNRFDVPDEFAPLLLEKATKKCALALCTQIRAQDFRQEGYCEHLLKKAATRGIESAEKQLAILINNRPPIGEIRIYRHVRHDAVYQQVIDITDGLETFEINLPPKLTRNYSPNIYLESKWLPLTLTAEEFTVAKKNIEDFFEHLKILGKLSGNVLARTIEAIGHAYFTDKREVEHLLKKFSGVASKRREREELYVRLVRERALKLNEGFLVSTEEGGKLRWTDRGLYFVAPEARILKLKEYIKPVKKKDLVRKMYLHGFQPEYFERCTPEREVLIEIAGALKTLAPAIAVVILP